MKNLIKKSAGVTLLTLALFPTAQVVFKPQVVHAVVYNYGGDDDDCVTVAKEDKNKSSAGDVSSGDAGGDWTVEGSQSYKIAKTLFEVLTKDFGLSGAAAAGWLGNVQAESGFNPNVTEAENGQNYAGRGYGLFQFTPGTKYLNSEFYKKGASFEEEIRNQVNFVMASEFKNGAYRSYLPNAQSWFGLTDVDGPEDVFDQSDPVKSMLIFFAVYERGDIAQMHRERRTDAAKRANELFNKENIKADKSKWVTNGSGTSNAATIDTGADGSKGNTKDDCGEPKKKSTGGGFFGKDGTGSHSQNVPEGSWGIAWKPNELPDELKQYAIDPESVGLPFKGQYGKAPWITTYAQAPGQCVELTVSLTPLLWNGNSKHMEPAGGNGWQNARSYADKNGGKVTQEPKAGAVFSTSEADNHTGVISHVFENGDVLFVEQNTPKSGNQIGEPCTWDYRLMKGSSAKAYMTEIWYPGDAGYEPNKDAKTLG